MFNEVEKEKENEAKLNNEDIECEAKENKTNEEIEILNFEENKNNLRKETKNTKLVFQYSIIFFSVLFLLCAFFLLLHISNNQPFLIIDDNNILKPINHEDKYRIIRLRNGIKAILISSNDKNSHFSLTIPMGYSKEKKDYGLAHLTEHMFFYFNNFSSLLSRWDSFITSQTKEYKTSLYYQVPNEHFAKSLFNFKKFIQKPKFNNLTRLNHEVNVINSEYLYKKRNNAMLQFQILKSFSGKNSEFKYGSLANKKILLEKWNYKNQKKFIFLNFFENYFDLNDELDKNFTEKSDIFLKEKYSNFENKRKNKFENFEENKKNGNKKLNKTRVKNKKQISFLEEKCIIDINKKNNFLNDEINEKDFQEKDLNWSKYKKEEMNTNAKFFSKDIQSQITNSLTDDEKDENLFNKENNDGKRELNTSKNIQFNNRTNFDMKNIRLNKAKDNAVISIKKIKENFDRIDKEEKNDLKEKKYSNFFHNESREKQNNKPVLLQRELLNKKTNINLKDKNKKNKTRLNINFSSLESCLRNHSKIFSKKSSRKNVNKKIETQKFNKSLILNDTTIKVNKQSSNNSNLKDKKNSTKKFNNKTITLKLNKKENDKKFRNKNISITDKNISLKKSENFTKFKNTNLRNVKVSNNNKTVFNKNKTDYKRKSEKKSIEKLNNNSANPDKIFNINVKNNYVIHNNNKIFNFYIDESANSNSLKKIKNNILDENYTPKAKKENINGYKVNKSNNHIEINKEKSKKINIHNNSSFKNKKNYNPITKTNSNSKNFTKNINKIIPFSETYPLSNSFPNNKLNKSNIIQKNYNKKAKNKLDQNYLIKNYTNLISIRKNKKKISKNFPKENNLVKNNTNYSNKNLNSSFVKNLTNPTEKKYFNFLKAKYLKEKLKKIQEEISKQIKLEKKNINNEINLKQIKLNDINNSQGEKINKNFTALKSLRNRVEDFFYKNYKVKDIVIIAKSSFMLDDLSILVNEAFNDLNWDKSNKDSSENLADLNLINNSINTRKSSFEENVNKNEDELEDYNNNTEYPFDLNNLGKLIIFKRKKKEKSTIDYFFPFPEKSFSKYDKPYEFLNYILKFENEGGLINKLKSAEIISNLNFDLVNVNKEYSLYLISIELSRCDERLIPVINNYLFQYIDLIRKCFKKKENSEDILNDVKKIMEINFELFKYPEEPNQIENTFQKIYENFNKYKKSELLFGEYDTSETTVKSFVDFLSFIKLENCVIMYGTNRNFSNLRYSKGLFKDEVITLETEDYYKTDFISGYLQNPLISMSIMFENNKPNFYIHDHFKKKENEINFDNEILNKKNKKINNIKDFVKKKFTNNTIKFYTFENVWFNVPNLKEIQIFDIFKCDNIRKKNNFITKLINYNRFDIMNNITDSTKDNDEIFPNTKLDKKISNEDRKRNEFNAKATNNPFGNWRNNPITILDQPNLKLYYTEQNNKNSNQISIFLEFIFIESKKDLFNKFMQNLFFIFLDEFINSKFLELEITGNSYSLELTENGILFKFFIFEDILPSLGNLLKNIFDTQENFEKNVNLIRLLDKTKKMIDNKINSEPLSVKLENEIFNKIIKYNYTNIFDLKNFEYNFLFEKYRKTLPSFLNAFVLKGSITGKFEVEKNLENFVEILKKLAEKSTIKDKDVFSLISMNRILDDSYIFRKIYHVSDLEESAMLNVYQFGEYDNKTFLCFKLLEIIMNIQFTMNDLVGIDLKTLKYFSHGLMISDGKILSYKFFAITPFVKECNIILNKSLYKFKKEFVYMTDEHLEEYKSILINLIKEENDKYNTLNLRSNYIWNYLEIKEFDYNKYLSDIYIQDIFKLYEKIFFDSKILSIQALSYQNSLKFKEESGINFCVEEIYEKTNLYMKVIISNFQLFDKKGDFGKNDSDK